MRGLPAGRGFIAASPFLALMWVQPFTVGFRRQLVDGDGDGGKLAHQFPLL
jgi:hypothetical protein